MQLLAHLLMQRILIRFGIFVVGVAGTLAALLGVFAQKSFIDNLHDGAGLGTDQFLTLLAIAAACLFAAQSTQALCKYLFVREGAVMHKALAEKIYRHTLVLRGDSRSRLTVGETVSLYAQDVSAVCTIAEEVLPLLAVAGTPILVFPFALQFMEDLPAAPLLATTVLNLVICLMLAQRQARLFRRSKAATAARVGIINEWLQNIRAVRMLGWISNFEKSIFTARKEETNARLIQVSNGSAMNGIMQVAPYLLNAVALTYTASRPDVTAGSLVAALWLCGVFMVRPLRSIPWTLVSGLDAMASAKRLSDFLGLDKEPDDNSQHKAERLAKSGPALRVRGLTVVHNGVKILDDISFDVEDGQCIGIVGAVGAGKTLLLHALLREVPCDYQLYQIYGHDALSMSLPQLRQFFGFVPQDGFIMSATVRDNVMFSYGSSTETDAQTLELLRQSAFTPDLETMDNGLNTEIGERGVNLSGGQRQRLSIARSVSQNRDIVLLDDSLSAVDVATEKELVSQLLLGRWKSKTRLLVTHRLSVLPECDVVWRLESGRLHVEVQP